MSTAKEIMVRMIEERPDDSSYDEILNELAFFRIVQRGLTDSDDGRIIRSAEFERRIETWRRT